MTTVSKPETVEATRALEPCPFCGDAMEDRGYGAIHVRGEECPIGGYAFDVAKWNARHRLNATPSRQDGLREALVGNRNCLATSIAFLNRDAGTDRINETVKQVVAEMVAADAFARAALSDTPPPDQP